ncbi:PREDICTED: defensin-like protein 21 [Tarenaya hassleriana]|uniref:defensin-like protein 21 n=1 Tax=Tarenaya hassleriana TaxID=28532 RepID=UPI00053C3D02|nr:PREDICTED: defensin-like protein 21 [Tarenaya hassleriana]
MWRTKSVSFVVLLMALALCIGAEEAVGEEEINGPDYGPRSESRCCMEHPQLGRCLPGHDDNPMTNGRCWDFCVSGCSKGGFCKWFGHLHKHECHCYC